MARCGSSARPTSRLVRIARGSRQARAYAACLDRLRRWRCSRSTRMSPRRGHAAAFDAYRARGLWRLGTRAQMNPPLRDRAHQEALWRASIRAWSTCWARTTRRTRSTKGEVLSGHAVGHARRADARAGDAGPRQCGTAQLARFVDLTSAGPRACSGSPARAASRLATTQT